VARLPVVGVLGSGSQPCAARAHRIGAWLAREGVHLLTGGGGGAMAEASRAFAEERGRAGLVLGVLPGAGSGGSGAAPRGYPNPWVEIAVRTHLPERGARGREPLSRNHVNVLTCDALIALPGGAGTASEVDLALAYGRPLVAWLEAREEIPGLAAEARVERAFEAVARFVRTELARVSRAPGGIRA
jgi:uncharacterized protein (TIGR00725 family)